MQQLIDKFFSWILRREEEYKRRTSVVETPKPHFKCNTIDFYINDGVICRTIVWSDGENLIMASPNDSLTQEQLKALRAQRVERLRSVIKKINR